MQVATELGQLPEQVAVEFVDRRGHEANLSRAASARQPHPRTTFHFVDASPAEALETAREAADGQDVRIGGGATVVRDFVAAGLVDHMHIVVVAILLGGGVRLWDGLEGLESDYEIESASAPSGSRM